MLNTISGLFSLLKQRNPLIHHITNKVTINDCANVTLAIGGAPVMADFHMEVEEVVKKADALLLNLGTLSDSAFEAMLLAGKKANQCGIPVILDPVGVGATKYRLDKAAQLFSEIKVTVLKGNHSEIATLVGYKVHAKGVDSGAVNDPLIGTAVAAAREFNCVIVISGETDVVATKEKFCLIKNGDVLLTKVSGTGCCSGSLISSFAAVTNDYFHAAIAGISTMGICGERAKSQLDEIEGLGTFKVKLFNEISKIDGDTWKKEVEINEF